MTTLTLRSLERYRLTLFAWLLVVVIGTLALFSYQSSKVFIDLMRPDLEAKAVLVSESLAAQFQRSAELGIGVGQLRGLPDFLGDAIDKHPDVAYAAVAVPARGLLFSSAGFERDARVSPALLAHVKSGRAAPGSLAIGQVVDVTTALPGLGPDAVFLHVGVDANYIETRLGEIKIDLFITLFVAVIITLEVLVFVMMLTLDRQNSLIRRLFGAAGAGNFAVAAAPGADANSTLLRLLLAKVGAINSRYQALAGKTAGVAHPLRQLLGDIERRFQFAGAGAARGGDAVNVQAIRLPLFIFFFATDMSRPFWPTFVGGFPLPLAGMDQNLMMALPMAMWGLTMLVVTPFGPQLVQRLGMRKALLCGMAPAALGILLCALAGSFVQLLFWRCLTAAGFGLVTVAGMLFVTMKAEEGKGARSAAIFIGAQTAAGVCGTAIGGILADRLGYAGTLTLSAVMVALNCLLVARIIPPVPLQLDGAKKEGGLAGFLAVARRWRFIAFVPLAALPPRIVLTGFLLYMIPVSLHHLEYSDAAIGRFMMCYFIANIFFTPMVARLLDRFGWHRLFLVAGTMLLGGAIHLFSYSDSVPVLGLSMVLLGLAMSLTTTALVSIIPGLFARESREHGRATVISLLRMVERIGSVLGPLVAASLITASGYGSSAAALAYVLMALALGLAVYFLAIRAADNNKKGMP